MIKQMPVSPSSLRTASCLRNYQNSKITKEFPDVYTAGPAARRGTILHGLLEHTLKHGYTEDKIRVQMDFKGAFEYGSWADHPDVWANCAPIIANIQEQVAEGWALYVEREACVSGTGQPCDYWAEDCYARAKIDVLMVSPDKDMVLVLDWKTGRPESINQWQMPLVCMILGAQFGRAEYGTLDFMIDTGEPVTSLAQIDQTLPQYLIAQEISDAAVRSVVGSLRELTNAHINNHWPTQPGGPGCRWCVVANCIHNGGKS